MASTTRRLHLSDRKQFSAVLLPASGRAPVHAQLLGGRARAGPNLSVLRRLRETPGRAAGHPGLRQRSNSGHQAASGPPTAPADFGVGLRRRRHDGAVRLLPAGDVREAISASEAVQLAAGWIECSTYRKQSGSSVRRTGSSLDRIFDVPQYSVWIECSTYRKQYSKVTKCLCLQLPPVGSSVRRPRPVDALCPAAGGQSEPPSGEVENRACGVEVAGNVGNGREEVSGRRRQRALERTLLRGDDGGDVDISPIPLDSLYDLPSTSLSAATSQSSLITHA